MTNKVAENSSKRSIGRPQKEPDWAKLDGLLAMDASKNLCLEVLEIADMTLDRHLKKKFNKTFTEYKATKISRTVLRLKQVMIKKAEQGDSRALEFVLKNLSDWRDNPDKPIDPDNNTLEFV